jgi:uncharacterized protein involved in type VI secretion and phage assembly
MTTDDRERALLREPQRVYGKYRGTVIDNDDDEKRGRLKVRVPAILGRRDVWALPCVPYAGNRRGLFALPQVNTGVWVEFEAGNIRNPIWTGCFWFENQIDAADASPHIKFFKTDKFTLRIDDEVGEITIENEGGSQIVLTAIDATIKSAAVYAEATNGRKVTLSATSVSVNDGALEVT